MLQIENVFKFCGNLISLIVFFTGLQDHHLAQTSDNSKWFYSVSHVFKDTFIMLLPFNHFGWVHGKKIQLLINITINFCFLTKASLLTFS